MIRNLKIEHRICENNLGDSTETEMSRYADELADALRAEYPDADITVNLLSNFANTSQTLVSGRGDVDDGDFIHDITENVALIANLVWDRM